MQITAGRKQHRMNMSVSNRPCSNAYCTTFCSFGATHLPSLLQSRLQCRFSCTSTWSQVTCATKRYRCSMQQRVSRRALLRGLALTVVAECVRTPRTPIPISHAAEVEAASSVIDAPHEIPNLDQKQIDLSDTTVAEPPVTARVYFDLSTDGRQPRRIVIGCYGTVAPETVRNFTELAVRSPEQGGYAHTDVYRIVPGLTVQMGDVLRNGGKSGRAANGSQMQPETYRILHTVPGIVSMVRGTGAAVDSRFFITTRPGDSSYLDSESHKYVAFGRVIDGFDVLLEMERNGSRGGDSKPNRPIQIQDCGLL